MASVIKFDEALRSFKKVRSMNPQRATLICQELARTEEAEKGLCCTVNK